MCSYKVVLFFVQNKLHCMLNFELKADTYVHTQHQTSRLSELHNGLRCATHVCQLRLRRTAYASTPVQQYLIKLPTNK